MKLISEYVISLIKGLLGNLGYKAIHRAYFALNSSIIMVGT